MRAELSSCVIQKFNGYDFLRSELKYYEQKHILPLDIVYEPTQDTTKPIYCFFAPKIYLAFQSCYNKSRNGKKVSVKCSTAKQCP